MAITRLGGANAISGTIPQGNIANASLGAVTALPAAITTGKVLQAVQASTATQANSNSGTYADTNLTASITPSSSSNKVLVLIQQGGVAKSNADNHVQIKVLRDSTEIGGTIPGRSLAYTGNSDYNYIGTGFSASILDSPSSTSALTYKTQFARNGSGGGFARVQTDSAISFITLLEIEA